MACPNLRGYALQLRVSMFAVIGYLAMGYSTATAHTFSRALDITTATAIVAPFYEALTASSAAMIAPLLDQTTSPGWMNCGANAACHTKVETVQRWSARVASIPDMQWTKKELILADSQIVVRGEVSGTPTTMFLGIVPRGRSFHVMTIDIHEVRDGMIVRTRHMEDWMTAVHQLSDSANTQ